MNLVFNKAHAKIQVTKNYLEQAIKFNIVDAISFGEEMVETANDVAIKLLESKGYKADKHNLHKVLPIAMYNEEKENRFRVSKVDKDHFCISDSLSCTFLLKHGPILTGCTILDYVNGPKTLIFTLE